MGGSYVSPCFFFSLGGWLIACRWLHLVGCAPLFLCLFRCSGGGYVRVCCCCTLVLALVGCSLWGVVCGSARRRFWFVGGLRALPVGCTCRSGCALPLCGRVVCLMCGPRCTSVRCPSCPPLSGPVQVIRLSSVVRSCRCPGCKSWALVLDSGAESPFCLCVVCGAGGMIIAAAHILEEQGHDPGALLFFDATDISRTCFNMTYLQTSILGLSGYVRHANSLSHQQWDGRFTPICRVYPCHLPPTIFTT